jgi:3-methyladenine DNA glycosylase/8-oxoguanine DNA glycosylase
VALCRAAAEVAAGRADLAGPDHERGWRRLRAIPGIGRWTIEMLALYGQGRYDQIPAADLGYLRVVGRIATGDRRSKATEDQVRAFFAPYGEWAGLAGAHLLGKGAA